jgi:ribosomal-protein-alanine N-acetyltransferase
MIRQMRSSDLLAASRLETELFGSSSWNLETLERELNGPDRYYVVWEGSLPRGLGTNPCTVLPSRPHAQNMGSEILGYGGIWVGGPVAQVMTVGVTKSAQGKGIGRAIMEALIDAATARGCQRVELQVRTDNSRAQKLYRHLGFRIRTVIPHYYQPENEDAFVMDLECTPHHVKGKRE